MLCGDLTQCRKRALDALNFKGVWTLGVSVYYSFLVFELAFLLAYKYAMDLSPRTGAPFWLPDAVLLCALLTSRQRYWLVYIAATLPLRLVIAVPPGTPVWFLLVAFANDSLKALLLPLCCGGFFTGVASSSTAYAISGSISPRQLW